MNTARAYIEDDNLQLSDYDEENLYTTKLRLDRKLAKFQTDIDEAIARVNTNSTTDDDRCIKFDHEAIKKLEQDRCAETPNITFQSIKDVIDNVKKAARATVNCMKKVKNQLAAIKLNASGMKAQKDYETKTLNTSCPTG